MDPSFKNITKTTSSNQIFVTEFISGSVQHIVAELRRPVSMKNFFFLDSPC